MPYIEAYPSLKEPQPYIFVIAGIFMTCFIVGICGNASTLTMILDIGIPKKARLRSNKQNTHDNFRVYMASLCVVDTLMLLSLPTSKFERTK